jgi:uncharacterized protein (DUF58 family)
MGRLLLLAGLLYGLFLAALGSLNGAMLALSLPIVVYLAAALLFAPPAPKLRISRTFSAERVQPGGTVDVRLEITNDGGRLEEMLVQDQLPPRLRVTMGTTSKIVLLPPGQTVELAYTVSGPRGQYAFQNVAATAGDHLGLFRRSTLASAGGRFLVLPELRRMRQVAIRPLRTRASAGMVPARQGGPGLAFFGVREYQPGDSLRWINWRATARHPRHIFTDEFEQERVADVGVILDARQRSDIRRGGLLDPAALQDPRNSLYEHSVLAAASLADAFLRSGDRVTLLMYGGGLEWVFPGYGRVQRERILQALARGDRGESEVFETFESLPTRLFPARSQIVLVSPLWSDDLPMLFNMRARGYEVLVVSPDPVGFERAESGEQAGREPVDAAVRLARLERAILLRRLRQAGVQVVDWPVDRPLDQAVLASLGHTPQWTRSVG